MSFRLSGGCARPGQSTIGRLSGQNGTPLCAGVHYRRQVPTKTVVSTLLARSHSLMSVIAGGRTTSTWSDLTLIAQQRGQDPYWVESWVNTRNRGQRCGVSPGPHVSAASGPPVPRQLALRLAATTKDPLTPRTCSGGRPTCAESIRASVAGWPGGISPPGSHRTERDSLPSLRSSHL
jgi:hypothetical protein